MARKRNPARLVVALSVAAVLAVFLLYTSIAGGGTPSIAPSELGAAQQGVVTLAGRVQPGYNGDAYGDGLRFRLRDIKGGSTRTVTVLYTGSVSDQFRAGREVTVKGELRNGAFVAVKDSLVTKCPSKYTAKKST
ncbi:MAG: cytochrome c maturation protein CcmE [Thermoleophilia bacterium]|nr:cytochrome c maturation protein CcmE [Thermoleophilia bacterium]